MKKYFLIISTLFLLVTTNSCSERELDLYPPFADEINGVDTESKMQQLLNGAYLTSASANGYGTELMLFGDLMGDKLFVSNSNPSYLNTYNFSFNSTQNDFSFYGAMYNVIVKCNMTINNTLVPTNANVKRIKAEAKILRGLAYFTLVNYYSPTPSSGVNQDFGVPLVLSDYDVNIQPARATVAQVYDQIITDLKAGAIEANAIPSSKVILSQTAAKLLLSRVYLTRRAAGDAALALQYATDIVDNSPGLGFSPVAKADYQTYFSGMSDDDAENKPETIWELDLNIDTNKYTGIGSNVSLPGYYNRTDSRKCMLFNQTFYNSFATSDVRRGPVTSGLLINVGVPNTDTPKGFWTNKYPRLTNNGNYFRNIKVLRFAEAQLNQIEALHLTGQNALALTKLNAFALSRNGSTYTGTNLLNDILAEKSKEFYGEGQRFLDLKRHNLPSVKPSNCTTNCNVAASDKLFVLPMSQGALNTNNKLTQYPGYN